MANLFKATLINGMLLLLSKMMHPFCRNHSFLRRKTIGLIMFVILAVNSIQCSMAISELSTTMKNHMMYQNDHRHSKTFVKKFVSCFHAHKNSVRSTSNVGKRSLAINAEKDWDAIIAEEGDGEVKSFKSSIPFDMRYNQRNCERSNQNFAAIKSAGGPGADIYGCIQPSLQSEINDDDEGVFWFLGKVSHISDVTIEQCVARLWPLIQQHAANLRPLELFGPVTNEQLDIWCAPLDSEFDVAYNRPHCTFTKMNPSVPGAESIKVNFIGFQGEVYDRGEEGFRTRRFLSNGMPSRPEITGPNEEDENQVFDEVEDDMVAPNDEQMEQLRKALEGKDINDLYEEQERRRKV